MGSKSMIRVGRGHDSEIRITDISVSRTHAFFRKSTRGDYLLEDNSSKFGTLVQVRKPYMLPMNFPNYVQLGRSILEIFVKQPNKFCSTVFGCCCPALVGRPPLKSTKA